MFGVYACTEVVPVLKEVLELGDTVIGKIGLHVVEEYAHPKDDLPSIAVR